MQPKNAQEPSNHVRLRMPSRKLQWGDTLLIWFLVALGGLGLWIVAADPLFGGPEASVFALTMFAFVAGMGVVATILIWALPAVWDRWFHQVPPEGGGRLDAAKLVMGLVFGI